MAKRIAIQGYEGSFHEVAALKFYGKKTAIIACDNFRAVVEKTINVTDCDGGIMAIENSIAGSILPNYSLLQKSDLTIIGEVYLQIKQNLMVLPGVQLEQVKEVHSHSMALLQCHEYLDKRKWKLVETEDTALSAKHIATQKSKQIAAVASQRAAELYNLEIVAPNIHTLKNNYTRFLILQYNKHLVHVPGANKASVYFHTDHSKGSLAKVLGTIANGGVNLSKLQSVPLPGSRFMYSFHADMEFESLQQFEKTMLRISPLTESLKVYGVYKKAKL